MPVSGQAKTSPREILGIFQFWKNFWGKTIPKDSYKRKKNWKFSTTNFFSPLLVSAGFVGPSCPRDSHVWAEKISPREILGIFQFWKKIWGKTIPKDSYKRKKIWKCSTTNFFSPLLFRPASVRPSSPRARPSAGEVSGVVEIDCTMHHVHADGVEWI